MACTAPTRGHYKLSAMMRCPEHRFGAGSPGSSGASRARRGQRTMPGTGPHTSSPSSRPGNDQSNDVERMLIRAGLDATAAGDFTGALIGLASALEDAATKRSKAGHWLCELLADAADALDSGVLAEATGEAFERALIEAGVPRWTATLAGWGIAKAAEASLDAFLPTAQLCLGLRVLGLLVCPEPESCPVEPRLSSALLKTALKPSTAEA